MSNLGENWARVQQPDPNDCPMPWVCPVCGYESKPVPNIWDGEWVLYEPNPCPGCEARRLGQRILADRKQWLIDNYGLSDSGVYGSMRFDTYVPDPKYPSQQQAKSQARLTLEQWKQGDWTKGLLLWSPNVGVGKTHLAISLVREGTLAYPRAGVHILTIWDMPSYVREIKASYDDGGTEQIIQSAIKPAILLLDDLGAEYAKAREWYQNLVYDVVNARWVKQKATVVTSNMNPKALGQHIGMRAVSRLLALTGTPVKMEGEDYRLRSL